MKARVTIEYELDWPPGPNTIAAKGTGRATVDHLRNAASAEVGDGQGCVDRALSPKPQGRECVAAS
jgi:hypothetical protein